MHEFGHTLGLGHGGSDGINDKPNYLSVMTYQYQFDHIPLRRDTFRFPAAEDSKPLGTTVDSVLDYSRWALPLAWKDGKQLPASLDENKLDEGFFASPAVAGKSLLLRTKTHLYRIEKPGAASAPQ